MSTVPVTPNLKLNLPPTGYPAWDPNINYNFVTIDSAIGYLQNSYQGVWQADVIYGAGQIVTYNAQVFISLAGGNVNFQPDISPAWWGALGSSVSIPYPSPGIAVSEGTAWGPSLNPNSIPGFPNKGVAVSTGLAWDAPIDPAAIAYLSAHNNFTQPNNFSPNANGAATAPASGLQLNWNLGDGVGETDFINCNGGVGGGFYWYNVAPGAALTSATPKLMMLDTAGSLWLNAIRFGDRANANFGPANGTANISGNSNTGNVVINPASGANSGVYFSRDQGAGGVYFGSGVANAPPVGSVDSAGNATFNGTLSVASFLRMGARTPVAQWQAGSANINADAANLFINSPKGTGGIYLGWDQGTNGTFFGNGAGAQVAAIGATGFGYFTSSLICGNSTDPVSASVGQYNLIMYTGGINSKLVATGDGGSRGTINLWGIGGNSLGMLQFAHFSDSGNTLYGPTVVTGPATMQGILYAAGPNANLGAIGGITIPTGYTVGWNLSNSYGETNFFNAGTTVPGGFSWYIGVNGTHFAPGVTPVMSLGSTGQLTLSTTVTTSTSPFFGLAPNMGAGTNCLLWLGQSNSVNNMVQFGFKFNANGSGNLGIFAFAGGNQTAYFDQGGNWHFLSAIYGTAKNFRIPHPLDETKYLTHSCLEGPEIGVFYRGEVTTEEGVASVTLPDYFEELTFSEDRSVLLTQIFEEEDELITMVAASRIVNGQFRVRSTAPSVKVSWEVKAVRRAGTGSIAKLQVVTDKEPLPPEYKYPQPKEDA